MPLKALLVGWAMVTCALASPQASGVEVFRNKRGLLLSVKTVGDGDTKTNTGNSDTQHGHSTVHSGNTRQDLGHTTTSITGSDEKTSKTRSEKGDTVNVKSMGKSVQGNVVNEGKEFAGFSLIEVTR